MDKEFINLVKKLLKVLELPLDEQDQEEITKCHMQINAILAKKGW